MSPASPGTGTMRIQLTDAPGEYDAIHLVIREVAAHRAGPDSVAGWVVINPESTTYDLLALRNGVFATLGTAPVPAGRYTQIRLLLGPGSDVVVDGVTHPLTVPSGLQTGVKLVGNFDVAPNGLTDIALDFDARRSVIVTGAGSYKLKPVVRAVTFSTAGTISGTVQPAGIPTTVYALQAPDTVGATLAAVDGSFKLCALPAGIYSVALHPDTAYRDTSLAGVAVAAGGTTSVGAVQLTHQ